MQLFHVWVFVVVPQASSPASLIWRLLKCCDCLIFYPLLHTRSFAFQGLFGTFFLRRLVFVRIVRLKVQGHVYGRGTMLLCWSSRMGWIHHSYWTDIWWDSVSPHIVKILMFMTQQIIILYPQIHWDLSKAYILEIFNGSVHEKEVCSRCSRQGEENLLQGHLADRTKTRLYASTGPWTVGIAEN